MTEAKRATIVRGTLITMNPDRDVIDGGAVLIEGDSIAAVGNFADLSSAHGGTPVTGAATDLVLPGYINGHQHLTGDRLIQSSIPDDLPQGESIFTWALPIHAEHGGDDDQLAATLTLAESVANGITTTFEAGTVAHPGRVAAAAEQVGVRLTVGTWGWDADEGPFTGSVDEVMDRQIETLDLATGPLVSSWVSLVGHDLMSDELVVAASALAKSRGVGLTFHMSPHSGDPESYLERTRHRPLVHLHSLGVLDRNVTIAHAVHIDDEEVAVLVESHAAVVSCPWAYLRLGQGVSQQFRHLQLWKAGGRLALGCDAENAGDMVDGVRTAALFAGLAKDVPADPTGFGAQEALELLTIRGAKALGIDQTVGSIEVGKQADLVIHDRSRLEWIPNSPDPVLQLIWGSDGRSVRDVYVAGQRVVSDGLVTTVDVPALAADAEAAGRALRARAGTPQGEGWPIH